MGVHRGRGFEDLGFRRGWDRGVDVWEEGRGGRGMSALENERAEYFPRVSKLFLENQQGRTRRHEAPSLLRPLPLWHSRNGPTYRDFPPEPTVPLHLCHGGRRAWRRTCSQSPKHSRAERGIQRCPQRGAKTKTLGLPKTSPTVPRAPFFCFPFPQNP
jgi:hypothetical protein